MEMTVKEFLQTHLALGCQLIQSGKMGTPTLEELDICGQLHSILEKLAEPTGSTVERTEDEDFTRHTEFYDEGT